MTDSQSPQDYFRMILLTVVEGAFNAAGYHLEERRVQWAGGMFRFAKALDGGQTGVIEFQHLHYAEGGPSRFNVSVQRAGAGTLPAVRRTLPALVVDDFGVGILPGGDHWWTYNNVSELGRALGEAGSLAIAYGMPWLSGELKPQ